MRTIIESPDDELAMVEWDGSLSSAEALWRMVLAMALKDHAWCIQYDVKHPARLIYITEWQVYGLVPPPDELADLLVRAIDRITRPRSFVARLLTRATSRSANRVTRSFWVKHEETLIPWVATWPHRASDGPVVIFRENYPGPDPSVRWNPQMSESERNAGSQRPGTMGEFRE
jgi:hypothetical protein